MYCPKCNSDKMAKTAGKAGSGNQRYRCKDCMSRTTQPLTKLPQVLPKTRITPLKKANRYLITSAVCDTHLVPGALDTFKQWCKVNDAKLMIVPTIYKNPTMYNRRDNATWWPEEILPYVCNVDFDLNKNIAIKGGTSIQHTALNPLNGLSSCGTMQSEIYAHAQIAMEMVATPKEDLPKMLVTTGTISQKNYSKAFQAQKAKFHHSIGGLIVETQGDTFWTRQFNFDGTGAADLDKYYTPTGVKKSAVSAIVYGDTHVRALKPSTELLFKSIRSKLKPEKNIFHDVHDHHAGSHHAHGNVIVHLLDKTMIDVRAELDMACRWLEKQNNIFIVDSNHDRHLNQWFNRFKPQNDPVNADLYFELAEMVRTKKESNLFKAYVDRYANTTVTFLDCNKKFLVAGVDCSQHGDRASNGSRGSAKAMTKAGLKMVIGHSHTPGIVRSVYQVGTSSMDMEYANGLSSWAESHCIIYSNGKRSLFFIVKDKLSPMMRSK